jgi:hypothetical protein
MVSRPAGRPLSLCLPAVHAPAVLRLGRTGHLLQQEMAAMWPPAWHMHAFLPAKHGGSKDGAGSGAGSAEGCSQPNWVVFPRARAHLSTPSDICAPRAATSTPRPCRVPARETQRLTTAACGQLGEGNHERTTFTVSTVSSAAALLNGPAEGGCAPLPHRPVKAPGGVSAGKGLAGVAVRRQLCGGARVARLARR